MSENSLPTDYFKFLDESKAEIRNARLRAAMAVNAELLQLYWFIGKTILEQQKKAKWGAKIIDQLGTDLRSDFPDMQGLSRRNLPVYEKVC